MRLNVNSTSEEVSVNVLPYHRKLSTLYGVRKLSFDSHLGTEKYYLDRKQHTNRLQMVHFVSSSHGIVKYAVCTTNMLSFHVISQVAKVSPCSLLSIFYFIHFLLSFFFKSSADVFSYCCKLISLLLHIYSTYYAS